MGAGPLKDILDAQDAARNAAQFQEGQGNENVRAQNAITAENERQANSIGAAKTQTIAGEVSKQGDITPLLNDAETTFKKLDNQLYAYHQSGALPGSANVNDWTGGRLGSSLGAAANENAKHLILTINKMLIGRFQMSGDSLLTEAMAPNSNYTPDKNSRLSADLWDTVQAIKSGKLENIKRVQSALQGDIGG